MGPPRRTHPQMTSNGQSTSSNPPPPPPPEDLTPLVSQTPPGANLGMSPASRYNHNLKVLRRRDPSIVSIFDQFSHVCIYHYDGQKWLKHGFEGTMFLFERNTYPPYGLYILNRVGMDDYVQGIYPEDDIFQHGNFVIVRSYPDFLARRLANIQPLANGEPPDKFSPVYAVPDIEDLDKTQKGRIVAKGFWTLATETRDSMMQVMLRLQSYIRKNQPYPDEFRYGPGRPPPPNRLRAVRKPGNHTDNSQSDSQATDSEAYQSDARADLSEVDKLFLKLAPTPSPMDTSSTAQQPTQSASLSLNSLFASVAGPSTGTPAPVSPSTSSSTGISLLDSIFASAASPSPHRPASTSIYSPQPTTSAPQVLTQDVLANLLGLPPTRTPSAASSVSISAASHPSSREGDNEDEGEYDSPSTMFNPEDELQAGPSAAKTAGSDLLSSLGLAGTRLGSQGNIHGDVTPRAPLNGLQRSTFPAAIESTSSTTTVRSSASTVRAGPTASEVNGKPRSNRALVPFEPDSELWPYSRGLAEENVPTDGNDDGEIVELSFEETSVLSDPEAFDKAVQKRRSAVHLRASAATSHTNGVHANGSLEERSAKGKKGKKGRKERDAREREEIERSWDVPPSPSTNGTGSEHIDMLFGPPASPSPCASPELGAHALVPEMKTPTMTARATLAQVNGHSNGVLSPHKGKGKAINGYAKMSMNGHVNGVDAETVRESLITAMEAQPRPVGNVDKMDFVKEVLTLVHTDKAFVDTLWHEYMARLA